MSDMTREEVNARLETIETRMDARLSTIEQMIDTNFARFDAKLQKNNADIIKWVAATVLAVGAVGLTLMTLLINNIPSRAASSTAPIVITLPGAAPAPIPPPSEKALSPGR